MTASAYAEIGNLFLGWGLCLALATLIVRGTNGAPARAIRRCSHLGHRGTLLAVLTGAVVLRWGWTMTHPTWAQEAAVGVFLVLITPSLLYWLIANDDRPDRNQDGAPTDVLDSHLHRVGDPGRNRTDRSTINATPPLHREKRRPTTPVYVPPAVPSSPDGMQAAIDAMSRSGGPFPELPDE